MTDLTLESIKALLDSRDEALIQKLSELVLTHAKGKSQKKSEASEEKPKKEANVWVRFTMRVEKLIREVEKETEVPAKEKMNTVTCKQFASHLKGLRPSYTDSWSDSEIKAALPDWSPPAVSKHSVKKAEKAEKAEVVPESAAAAAAPKVTKAAAKPKAEPKTEEQKATEKAEKEAAKLRAKAEAAAKKAVEKAEAAAKKAAEAKAALTSVSSAPAAKAVAAVAAKAEALSLDFRAWTHNGTDYWKNDRGDLLSSDQVWVGRYNSASDEIEEIGEPEDLENAEFIRD